MSKYDLGKSKKSYKTFFSTLLVGILSILTLCFSQNFAHAEFIIYEPQPAPEETEKVEDIPEETINETEDSVSDEELDADLVEKLKQAQERALAKKAEEEILEKAKANQTTANETSAVLTEEDYERIKAEIKEELENAENEKTEPLGVTENLAKVENEDKKNNIITIVCIIVIAISVIGIVTIILLPFLRKDRKRNAKIKF